MITRALFISCAVQLKRWCGARCHSLGAIILGVLIAPWPLIAQITIEDIGPSTSNFNLSLSGYNYPSGKVQSLTVASDGQRLYAGTAFAGVWRSDDAGKTWYQPTRPQPGATSNATDALCQFGVPGGLCNPNVYDVVVSPANKDIVFATGVLDTRVDPLNGVYRSTDGGQTWALVLKFSCSELQGAAGKVTIAPDDAQLIYAAGGCAIAVSKDGGSNWKEIPLPDWQSQPSVVHASVWRIAVAPLDGARRRVWAGANGQMYYSEDAGQTWFRDNYWLLPSDVGYPDEHFGVAAMAFAVEPGHPDHLYVAHFWGAGDTPILFDTVFNRPDGTLCGFSHKPGEDPCTKFTSSLWIGDYSSFKTTEASPSATWQSLPSPPVYTGAGESSGSGNAFVLTKATSTGYLVFFSDRNGVHVSAGQPTSHASWHRFDGTPACLTYNNSGQKDIYYLHPDPHSLALSPDFEITLTPATNIPDPYGCTLSTYISGTAWQAHDGGVSYTQDGGESWTTSSGLATLQIQARFAGLARPDLGFPALYVGVPDNDNFYTTDGGTTWKAPESGCGDCSPWFADAAQYTRVVEFNRGASWSLYDNTQNGAYPEADAANVSQRTEVPAPTHYDSANANWVNDANVPGDPPQKGYRPIVQTLKSETPPDALDFVLIRLTPDQEHKVLRAPDLKQITTAGDWDSPDIDQSSGSKVWQVGPSLSDNTEMAGVNVVQASGGHTDTVYFVSDSDASKSLWKWTKGMTAWEKIVPGGPSGHDAKLARRFFADPYNSNRIYIVDENAIKRSDTGGATWNLDASLDGAITEGHTFRYDGYFGYFNTRHVINDMIFDRNDPNRIFAVGNAGVFNTRDGVNWVRLLSSAAIPMNAVTAFYDPITDSTKQVLYVGTDGRSILKVTIPTDVTPPVTTAMLDPTAPNGNAGWYISDVTVTLAAADLNPDNSPGSGVVATYFRVNGGAWQTYSGPFTVGTEKLDNAVEFYSVDAVDNTEAAKSVHFKLDKHAPATTVATDPPSANGNNGWYTSSVTVTLSPSDPQLASGDPGSGVAATLYRVNGGDWKTYSESFVIGSESQDNVVEFYSADVAGNKETTQSIHFKIDKTPPIISITSGRLDGLVWDQTHLARGVLTNSSTLALSGNAADNFCLTRLASYDDGTLIASQAGGQTTSLTYALNLQLHLGINLIDVAAEDCAGWQISESIAVVYVVTGPYDPRSKGFWYNAVKNGSYTASQMQTLLSDVNIVSDVFGAGARNIYGPVSMANYQGVLSQSGSNMELMQKAELLGTWLNLVSGRMPVLTAVNMVAVKGWALIVNNTGGSPLTFALNVPMEVEEVDQTRAATSAVYQVAKNLLEAINLRKITP
jgi:hypothetical protein